MIDTAKLTRDAIAAKAAAIEAAKDCDDGGSCNIDAAFLKLAKGERSSQYVKALAAAGLHSGPCRWIGRGVMIEPPCDGQANRRYVANQALCKSLRDSGWRVIDYLQMD